jgi:hypothetical protein
MEPFPAIPVKGCDRHTLVRGLDLGFLDVAARYRGRCLQPISTTLLQSSTRCKSNMPASRFGFEHDVMVEPLTSAVVSLVPT